MTNKYVEGKGPQGPQIKESLAPTAVTGYNRGLCVNFGATNLICALVTVAGSAALGILEEDAVSTKNPCSTILFGEAIAQIGANITAQAALATDANGRLVPATAGQQVVAIALEPQTYVAPDANGEGSFALVLFLGADGPILAGPLTFYYTASGALAPMTGTHVLDGAAAIAMTLVAPPNDGIEMYIVAQTAHAHTVTTPGSGIYGAKHVITYAAEGDGATVRSAANVWMVPALGGPTPAALS
jgi:hypothetical protein